MGKYKWTQEDENGFVTTAHAADLKADENEKRRILQDLGEALSHPGYNDNEYPKNMTPKPYVRGAQSDADYQISVPSDKVVKIAFGTVILYLKNSDGEVMWSKNGTDYYPFVCKLSELLDVQISNPQNGQFLKYDSSSQKWINAT